MLFFIDKRKNEYCWINKVPSQCSNTRDLKKENGERDGMIFGKDNCNKTVYVIDKITGKYQPMLNPSKDDIIILQIR